MIKLFGWESKMSSHIAEKRDEEMIYLRNFRLFELLNNTAKYVDVLAHLNVDDVDTAQCPRTNSHHGCDIRDLCMFEYKTLLIISLTIFPGAGDEGRIDRSDLRHTFVWTAH